MSSIDTDTMEGKRGAQLNRMKIARIFNPLHVMSVQRARSLTHRCCTRADRAGRSRLGPTSGGVGGGRWRGRHGARRGAGKVTPP